MARPQQPFLPTRVLRGLIAGLALTSVAGCRARGTDATAYRDIGSPSEVSQASEGDSVEPGESGERVASSQAPGRIVRTPEHDPSDVAGTASALSLVSTEPLPTDQATLQAQIDAKKASCGVCVTEKGATVSFSGQILLSSPLKLYSGITLEGAGPGAVLRAAPNFAGSSMITLTGALAGNTYYYVNGVIRNLSIIGPSAGSVAAIDVSPASATPSQPMVNVTNSLFENLMIGASMGIRLNYAQHCVLRRLQVLTSFPMAQFLSLRGNNNLVESLDVTNAQLIDPTLPLIYMGRSYLASAHNVWRHILVEGPALAGKRPLLFEDSFGTVMNQVWFEYNTLEPPMEIRNSIDTRLEAVVFSVSGTKMILDNAFVSMDTLDVDDKTVGSSVIFRGSSWLSLDLLMTRRGENALPMNANFTATSHLNKYILQNPTLRWVANSKAHENTQPLSFKLPQLMDWTLGRPALPPASSFPTTVRTSNVTRWRFAYPAGQAGVADRILFPKVTAQAGVPVTVELFAKTDGATGVYLAAFGAGMEINAGSYSHTLVRSTNWHKLQLTVTPPVSGDLSVGVVAYNAAGLAGKSVELMAR